MQVYKISLGTAVAVPASQGEQKSATFQQNELNLVWWPPGMDCIEDNVTTTIILPNLWCRPTLAPPLRITQPSLFLELG